MKPAIHNTDHWPAGADPISERWQFVLPVSPATADDYVASDAVTAPFTAPWGNITGFAATAFRLVEGRLQLRLACTGGEDTPDSVIFTLPATHRPAAKHRHVAVLGTDAFASVDVNTDGTVVFKEAIIGSEGPTGPPGSGESGIFFDVANSGTTLDVTTSSTTTFAASSFQFTTTGSARFDPSGDFEVYPADDFIVSASDAFFLNAATNIDIASGSGYIQISAGSDMYLIVGNDLSIDSQQLGFFAATPVAQQSLVASPTGAQIRAVLAAYGLVP